MKATWIIILYVFLGYFSYGQLGEDEKNFLNGNHTDASYVTNLNLDECSLKELPDVFDLYTSLISISLVDNQLTSLPPSLGRLKSVELLSFSGNKISKLPEVIEWENLDFFDASDNLFQEIPKGLLKSHKLTSLYFYSNKISVVPDEICQLTALETLGLSYNEIHGLPSCIGNLSSLESLNIGNNKFTDFPDVITNIPNLKVLDFDQKTAVDIPQSIKKLQKLESIEINKSYYKSQKAKLKAWLPKNCKINEPISLIPPEFPATVQPFEEEPNMPLEDRCFVYDEESTEQDKHVLKRQIFQLRHSNSRIIVETIVFDTKEQLEEFKKSGMLHSSTLLYIDGTSVINSNNLTFEPEEEKFKEFKKSFGIIYEKGSKNIEKLKDPNNDKLWHKGECPTPMISM